MVLVGKPAEPVLDLVERVALIVFRVVGILMRVAPIGAFGAMAFTIGKYGVEIARQPRLAGQDLLRHFALLRAGGAGHGCPAARLLDPARCSPI